MSVLGDIRVVFSSMKLSLALFLLFSMTSGGLSDVIQLGSKHITARRGEDVILPCTFTFPEGIRRAYVVQWQKHGDEIPFYIYYENNPPSVIEEYDHRVIISGLASLNLTGVRETDEGWYQCEVFFVRLPLEPPISGIWVLLEVVDGTTPSATEETYTKTSAPEVTPGTTGKTESDSNTDDSGTTAGDGTTPSSTDETFTETSALEVTPGLMTGKTDTGNTSDSGATAGGWYSFEDSGPNAIEKTSTDISPSVSPLGVTFGLATGNTKTGGNTSDKGTAARGSDVTGGAGTGATATFSLK